MKFMFIFRCFLFSLSFVSFSYVNAQGGKMLVKKHAINLGIKLGINVNRLETRIDKYINENYIGFNGGIFARFNFNRLHFQPEFNFSMIGGEGFFENGGRYNIKFNTLELPIALGYKVLDFKLLNIRINAGAFASFSLSRYIYVSDPYYPTNSSFTNDKLAFWNGGILLGLGGDIWRFTIDARYKFGFVNLLGSNVLAQDPGAGFKNGHFECSIGFKLF